MSEPILEVLNVVQHFERPRRSLFAKKPKIEALKGVSFRVNPGESFGIVGESGSGKSTLAKAILALEEPTSGTIRFMGQNLFALPAERRRQMRRHIQMVFQDPFGSLDPRLSVRDIVTEPLDLLDEIGADEWEFRANEAITSVGLQPSHLDKFPHEFSGGQRQRIAIARALITRPDLIVADEPVSALDVSVQAQVLNLMMDLQERFGLTYIIISHDLSVVRHVTDRLAVMEAGLIVEQGDTRAIFKSPQHPYTRELLDAVLDIPGRIDDEEEDEDLDDGIYQQEDDNSDQDEDDDADDSEDEPDAAPLRGTEGGAPPRPTIGFARPVTSAPPVMRPPPEPDDDEQPEPEPESDGMVEVYEAEEMEEVEAAEEMEELAEVEAMEEAAEAEAMEEAAEAEAMEEAAEAEAMEEVAEGLPPLMPAMPPESAPSYAPSSATVMSSAPSLPATPLASDDQALAEDEGRARDLKISDQIIVLSDPDDDDGPGEESAEPGAKPRLDGGMTIEAQNLIDGRWQDALGQGAIEIVNPSDGQTFGQIARGTDADIDEAVRAAYRAMAGPWGRMPAFERGRVLARLAELVLGQIDRLAALEARDVGKPLGQARADAVALARYFEFYGGAADKIHGQTIPYHDGYTVLTLREPHGVTGHIVPWNYPMQIIGRSVGAALAMGNACVLKPGEDASLTALEIGQLALEAGLPPGVLNIVTGYGDEAGAALAAHPGIDHLSFTGSVRTGKLVQQAAASHSCPVTLELGGKSPQIVFEDADLEQAIPFLVKAAIQNAGQTCSAGSRVLIQDWIYHEVVHRLTERFENLDVGPADRDLDCGPVINPLQKQRIERYLQRARTDRIEILGEGEIAPGAPAGGYYVKPTLLGGVDPEHPLAQEEIFGPILSAIRFTNEDDALRIANNSVYGLVAGIWTKDGARQMRLARAIKAGQVFINNYDAGGGVELPFGGVKSSGFGREKGFEALYGFSTLKTIAMHHG